MLLRILITICLLFCLTGCDSQLGNITEENTIVDIREQLETNKQPNGKYQKMPDIVSENYRYQIDEYETAKGEIGYSITITKIKNNKIYQKKIVKGVLKSELEYNWIYIADVYKSSTSTTKSL